MWKFSSISFLLCFLCFFFIGPHENNSVCHATASDIIKKTCKKCADDSKIFDFNFCLTSLQSVPVSHATNLQGPGIVALELAQENTTSTVTRMNSLLNNGTLDPYALACLKNCLELYSDAAKTLVFSVGAFLSGDYHMANMWVSAVMEATTTCEERFTEKGRKVSPLTTENHNLFQLCDIALCITNKLAVPAYL